MLHAKKHKCGITCLYFWKVRLFKSLLGLDKNQFQYVTVIILLCTEYFILIHTFLSTLLTHSLSYNGFWQYVVNRCIACYVSQINLGEIFISNLNFHWLIMLMYNLKHSLIKQLSLVLTFLEPYLIINRNYINCKWLKCYLKYANFIQGIVSHLYFTMQQSYCI